MKMPLTTGLLSGIAVHARSTRPRFSPPESYFTQVTPTYAEIWFPTGGCFWDSLGHCTMCNYGAPEAVEPDAMIRAVELAAGQIAPTTETLWVSAFNSLQEREVPGDARQRIFDIIASTPAKMVVTETHPASVRAPVLTACLEQLGGRSLGVELGVETMDEFVRYACVNKPYTNSLLERAVTTIHETGAYAWANLIVGIPFLDPGEAVADAARSVRDAAGIGFDRIMLFPNHIKKHTVAEMLSLAGMYSAPDLWLLRDVLAELPDDLIGKVYLAWVDVKPHPGAPEIINAPDPEQTARLHSLLMEFNWGRDANVLRRALELPRPQRMVSTGEASLVDRLMAKYQWLCNNHGEPGWWQAHAEQVRRELEAGYASSSLSAVGT
jgi:archaeosine synthase beta-subunit